MDLTGKIFTGVGLALVAGVGYLGFKAYKQYKYDMRNEPCPFCQNPISVWSVHCSACGKKVIKSVTEGLTDSVFTTIGVEPKPSVSQAEVDTNVMIVELTNKLAELKKLKEQEMK